MAKKDSIILISGDDLAAKTIATALAHENHGTKIVTAGPDGVDEPMGNVVLSYPYKAPVVMPYIGTPKSGKQNRRERRKNQRKAKKKK